MKNALGPIDKRLAQKALDQVDDLMAGRPAPTYRRVELPLPAGKSEVRAARESLHATQVAFAKVLGVSLETVKAWEAGRRTPEGPATKVIRLIAKDRRFGEALAGV